MALPYYRSGTFTRSAGLYSALAKQSKLLNLKPAKRIEFTFDPFSEDSTVVRHTVNYFYQDRVRETNPKCALKTNIVSNRAEPTIVVKLVDGKSLVFKTKNLQPLNILEKYNELVSSQVAAEEKATETATTKLTKSQKRR